MGLGDKLIARVEYQAETLAEYRQLDEKRRARICELERKLGDAEREQHRLAWEVGTLRQERDLARVEIMTFRVSDDSLRKERDHWKESRQDAHEAGELMLADIETLRQQLANAKRELSEQGLMHGVELQRETADLRQQLDAAQAALTRERLDAEARGHELELLKGEAADLRQQLANAQREASEEFVERQVLQHEASDGYVEMERLREFVGKVRRTLPGDDPMSNKLLGIEAALNTLDNADTPQPTPVAEPLDAEGGA